MKKAVTKEELDRWIREAQMHAEFPQHRAHGMYGDPRLDKINRDKKNKKSFLDAEIAFSENPLDVVSSKSSKPTCEPLEE